MHRPPRKQPATPPVVADTFVPDGAMDAPEYARVLNDRGPIEGDAGRTGVEGGGAAVGEAKPVDPRDLQVHRDPPPRDVPYLPTDQHVVNKMLEMARVTKDDVLYDLGCGDGRICITAAKLGAKAVGVEIDLQRLRECHDNLRNTRLKHLVEFRKQSFFDVDLRPATVVALYLLPAINKLLRPKLLHELRPGARIIANYFEIADWIPDEQVVFKHRPVMLWIVPAWVQGRWKCVFKPAGGKAFHVEQAYTRVFQRLSATAKWGKRKVHVEGRIRGAEVLLTYPELSGLKGPVELRATYDDGAVRKTTATLRGTFTAAGGERGEWAGMRVEGG